MRQRAARTASWALAAVLAGAATAAADIFVLTNGDQITGKRLRGSRRTFVVQTEFGRLTIPRDRVEKIIKDDGSEEVIAPAEPTGGGATASPAGAATARLALIVVGKSFWLAWDPKHNPLVDPSLRLEVRLDDKVVASYVDVRPDPRDLPGATVNTFSYLSGEVEMEGSAGVRVLQPEVRPGRASLRMDVPVSAQTPAARRLRVAYQFNAGTADEPAWKDAVAAETSVELNRTAPAFILVRQDAGRMEYSGFPRRRMRNIETFRLELTAGS